MNVLRLPSSTTTQNTLMNSFSCPSLEFYKYEDRLFLYAPVVVEAIHPEYVDLEVATVRITFSNGLYHVEEINPWQRTKNINFSIGLPITFESDIENQNGKFAINFMTEYDGGGGSGINSASYSTVKGIGTIHVTDIQDPIIPVPRPMAPQAAPLTEGGSGEGGSGGVGEETDPEEGGNQENSGFFQGIVNFFRRIFNRNDEPTIGQEPSETPSGPDASFYQNLPAPIQKVHTFRVKFDENSCIEMRALSAFDMVVIRTSKDNVKLIQQPTDQA